MCQFQWVRERRPFPPVVARGGVIPPDFPACDFLAPGGSKEIRATRAASLFASSKPLSAPHCLHRHHEVVSMDDFGIRDIAQHLRNVGGLFAGDEPCFS